MTILLITALAAATASIVATAGVAYVVLSFHRGGHLLASRIGRQPRLLVLAPAHNVRRRRTALPARIHLQPLRVS